MMHFKNRILSSEIICSSKIEYYLLKLELWKLLVHTNSKIKAVSVISDNDRARNNVSYRDLRHRILLLLLNSAAALVLYCRHRKNNK